MTDIEHDTIVIDANVIIRGRGRVPDSQIVLVPSVVEEMKSEMSETLVKSLDYSVDTPSESSKRTVSEVADNVKSLTSEADQEIAAVALERDIPVLTDDVELQNLCIHLGVDVEGYMDEAIEEKFVNERVCVNCGAEGDSEKCPNCGSTRFRFRQDRRS